MQAILRALSTVLFVAIVSGCQVNPVTGERHFQIYGSDWERQVGEQMYAPMKQSQGGEFILDPELTAYVQGIGNRLAGHARRKDELKFEFSVLNHSTPNAWALPGGKIVVNRGLLTELDSEAELAAVIGHEIVHADAAHGARQQSTGMLAQVGAVASMVVLGSKVESRAAREIAMLVPAVGAQLVMQKYGRDAERESDQYGMRYMSEAGYDPQGAVRLQETFVELSKERKENWLSGLFASHPPSKERVENNRETAAELPAGGEMGREQYQQRTAYLHRVKPAYDAYDEAGKALSEEKFDAAQRKLDEAMKIEPREAWFMAMQGDIHALQKRDKQALDWYGRSIKANDNLFYPYLRRGQVEYRQKNTEAAQSNLERSLELLPTAEAHYVLGRIARDRGDMKSASEHFAVAAQSNSAAGKSAQAEMVRLDIGQNASRYIASRAAIDEKGNVWVQVGNTTDVPVRNIQIRYQWLDDQGRTRESQTMYSGPLAGRQQDQIRLDVRLPGVTDLGNRFKMQVTTAEVAE